MENVSSLEEMDRDELQLRLALVGIKHDCGANLTNVLRLSLC